MRPAPLDLFVGQNLTILRASAIFIPKIESFVPLTRSLRFAVVYSHTPE
jgi:hypothetical protein